MSTGPKDPGAYAGEGFLSRWSRRKRLDDAQAEAPDAPPTTSIAPFDARKSDVPADERPRCPESGEVIDEEHVASLPRIDDIRPGDDLSGFMRRGVPEALRRQALRTMWTTDPVIRDYVSPALDYAHDYNTPGAVVGFEPLSESELESARAMVGRMFSTPKDLPRPGAGPPAEPDFKGGSSASNQIVSESASDTESQPHGGEVLAPAGHADAAAQQQNAAAARLIGGGDAPVTANDAANADVSPDSEPQRSSPAMLQRSAADRVPPKSMGEGADLPSLPSPPRRRGGRATPI